MTDKKKPQQNQHLCPTCATAVTVDAAAFPFCSNRCKDADLNKWFSGRYVISRPIEQADLDEV